MKYPLLYIRWRQINQEIKGLGLYALIFVVIIVGLTFVCIKQFEQGHNATKVIFILTTLCAGVQFFRKDKLFIHKNIVNPHVQIFLEYVVLTLPFSISSIFTKSWFYYPILLIILFHIPFIKGQFKQRTIFRNLSFIIRPKNFEWISGIRQYYFLLITFYLLALIFCWLKFFPLFSLWLLTVFISFFYTECESVSMLREYGNSPTKFLFDKYKSSIIYMVVLYLPVLIANSICNADFIFINMSFFVTQIALICFTIGLKYSMYKPNGILNINMIPLIIIALCSLIPYFFPISIILSLIYFYKAKNNLKQYLND